MSNFFKLAGMLILGFAILFGGCCFLVSNLNQKASDQIFLEGKRAYFVDVKAEANPYQGENAVAARVWLNGWIEAKEEGQ